MANRRKKLLTYLVGISHVQDIGRMNILVQCFLNQILRLVSSQLGYPAERQRRGGKLVEENRVTIDSEQEIETY